MRAQGICLLSIAAAAYGGTASSPNESGPGQGRASAYVVNHWGTAEGLPQTSVLSIIQTRDKYIWLATFGGLVRFDGLSFTTFEPAVNPGIRGNRIVGLCEDREGTLWIAMDDAGLAAYRAGRFTTYGTKDGLPSNAVRTVAVDSNGEVWIATKKGLVTWRDRRFQIFQPGQPMDSNILTVAAGKQGRLWVGTNSAMHLIQEGRIRTTHPGTTLTIYEDSRDRVWAGSPRGLFRFGLNGLPAAGNAAPLAQVPGDIRALFESSSGALWAGSSTGLWQFNGAARWTRHSEGSGLEANQVRAVMEDNEGNLWVGTNAHGLYRLKRRRIQVAGAGKGVLPGANFVPVLEDRAGAMWFGLTCGGVVRLQPSGRYDVFEPPASDCVWALMEDRDGVIWAGTRLGVSRFRNGRFESAVEINSRLSDPSVTVLYQDRTAAVWIGTGFGLNRWKDGRMSVLHKADGLVEEDIRFLTEDPDGAMWIGTTGGMSRYRDGVFTSFSAAQGLPASYVRAIHFGSEGSVWIGTYGGGLARMRGGGGRLIVYNTASGLRENVVSRILEDDRGNLWLSGNQGVHRVSLRQLNDYAAGKLPAVLVSTFGTTDGMLNRECNGGGFPAGWKGRDGKLWFPTQQGVAVIDPANFGGNQPPPPAVIERVLVNRQPVDASRPVVRIPPGPSDLEVHYTGLSFAAPERIWFRYKLDDLESEWVDVGTRRAAYYTRLPPGRYLFSAMAAHADGPWSGPAAQLEVEVIAPFWMSWWFRLAVLGSLLAAVAWMNQRRIQRLQAANAQQASFARRLIDVQESERKRIAGGLHDSLGQTLAVIKNRALLSRRTPEDVESTSEQLDEIANAAHHALDEVREIAFDLRPYHLDRLGLGKAIEAMLSRAGTSCGIRFQSSVDGLDRHLPSDLEINIYRVVQEAVNNIIRHSDATQASVSVSQSPGALLVKVEDNGKGFVVSAARGAQGAGFGLNGIAERARLLGGAVDLRSAPGKGTRVEIRIPRKEE